MYIFIVLFSTIGFWCGLFLLWKTFHTFQVSFHMPMIAIASSKYQTSYVYRVSCQIPMLTKGVISHQSQNHYFSSQCAKEKGPNNNPEMHHVQTQFWFYTTRIANWYIYLWIKHISSRIARPTNATQMWQVIPFLFYNPCKTKEAQNRLHEFSQTETPKKKIWYFISEFTTKKHITTLYSLSIRSIHLIDILPFRDWSFAVANHKVVGTLFDCYMCVLGSKQTTKTFSTDMMTWWHFTDLNGVTIPLMRNKKSPFSWLRKPEQG